MPEPVDIHEFRRRTPRERVEIVGRWPSLALARALEHLARSLVRLGHDPSDPSVLIVQEAARRLERDR